ncbi:hypothetical protein BGZ73_007671 [Actinomortierella ambigua]|nr:hypothetical protein BGZ73_007671 [Actinomortierella ambigua]
MSSSSLSEPLTPPPDTLSDAEDQLDQQRASLFVQERPMDVRKTSSASAPSLATAEERTSSDNDEVEELTTTTTTTTTAATARLPKGGKDFDGLTAHHNRLHQRHRSHSEGGHSGEITGTSTSSHDLHEPTTLATGSDSDAKKHKDTQSASGSTEHGPEGSLAAVAAASTSSGSRPDTPSSAEGGEGYQTILTTTTTTTRKRKVRRPTFEARPSRLDPETMTKNQDPFRGFHTLFWIVMGAYGVITFHEEWTRVGKLFGGSLFSSFSQDAIFLAFSDFCLVLSTFFAFALVKLVAKGWISDWPWVQSGFFTLHGITMLMKIHSYITSNGEYSDKLSDLEQLEAVYGDLKKNDTEFPDDAGLEGSDTSDDDLQSRHKASAIAASILLKDHQSHQHPRVGKDTQVQDSTLVVTPQMLADEIKELRNELTTSTGELWPANVTVWNFMDYLLVPTLIYELRYPRTEKIRLAYIFEKAVATLGTFTLLYLTTEHYIYPVIFDERISPLRALVMLLIPFMMNYLMIFYIIFECICNAFAELSCFADRNFYEDWWNCETFDEWARKWNKPVHNFLLRHVYASGIESWHLSKSNAALLTFFLSSCVHELVMMVVTRKVRMYLFFLQMFQLPLIWMGNSKIVRSQPRLANAFFWMGMFCGPPLLGVAYCYA